MLNQHSGTNAPIGQPNSPSPPRTRGKANATRTAQQLADLKQRPRRPKAPEDDPAPDPRCEPLDSNRLYSPQSLREAMGIGRRYYDKLLARGLPHRYIDGRYWFSGRLVIQFMEKEGTDAEQAGKR